ncbi:MAG: FAD-dependent thymidylate synthase, partial [Parachlamydiales bacterium]
MSETFEEFTDAQKKILEKYVSNTTSNLFVIRALPEVIKGALFSRYSRSNLGLRSLLLSEFIQNEDTSFAKMSGGRETVSLEEQSLEIQKAQNFYDRILDGYGDDSIGELGGAHLALENVSMIAAKQIEDSRIGGSPLEKSTRYMYFDQKVKGEYLFYKEPILMTSAYRELYLETCNFLFDTYSKLIPPLTASIEQKFPKEHEISKVAYTAALRAKVLDCLRGLLPSSALTNLGLFGNGRFFEKMIQQLSSHNLTELQEIGKEAFSELSKTIPSFIRRSDPSNKYYQSFALFSENMKKELKELSRSHSMNLEPSSSYSGVKLINFDKEAVYQVAASLLFEERRHSLEDLQNYVRTLSSEEIGKIFAAASAFR